MEPHSGAGASLIVPVDVVYSPAFDLHMDVYEPPLGGGPFPGVLLLHPGGFVSGDRSDMAGVAAYLSRHDYVAFSIDYRLAPAYPFGAAVEDARQAVRYMRRHAAQFHVDPERIAAFGASAGANLAAMVGWSGRGPVDSGDRVGAVVSWSGPLDLEGVIRGSPEVRSIFLQYANAIGVTDRAQQARLLAGASPVTYLDPTDPPSFIANGRSEIIPLAVAREAARDLIRAKVAYQLAIYPHGHALDYTSLADRPTLSFLNQVFVTTRPSPSATASNGPRSSPSGVAAGPPSSGTASIAIPASLAGVAALAAATYLVIRRRRVRPPPSG